MALCIPTLVGPVSELTKSIRVQGALPGATIRISAIGSNPREVAKGIASGGNDRIPIYDSLKADDILVVAQELSDDTSGTTAESMGMPVQQVPAKLGHVGFVSHLYKCGSYLWLSGGFPGATVDVRDSTNTVIGSGESEEGDVRMTLSAPLSGVVTAYQRIPSVTGPIHYGYPDQINLRPLSSPSIMGSLIECQTQILVHAVFDGAQVTVQKDDGTEQSAGFDRNSLWFPLTAPLAVGEKLKVRQTMHRQCEQFSDFSIPYSVQEAADVPPPVIQTPICAGSRRISVSTLIPGSIVTLTINGKMYKGMPAGIVHSFEVDSLAVGTVKATMELCGVIKESTTVQIDPSGNQLLVKLLEPLYSCARAVSIGNITPGTALQVWKSDGVQETAISSIHHIFSQEVSIPVTPYLQEGEKLWVKQWSCSDVAITSNSSVVVAHPTSVSPVIIEPVYTNTSSFAVKNAVAGALVEAYIQRNQTTDWAFCGSAIGKPALTILPLNLVLAEGDRIKIRQLFCSAEERLSLFTNPPVTVVAYTATKTATRSGTFTRNNCPGGQTGSSVLYSQSATATAKSIYSQADADQKAQLAAETSAQQAVDAGGQAYANQQGSCRLPSPVLDSYDTNTFVLKGKGFKPSAPVWIRMTVSGTVVVSDSFGNLASLTDYRSGFPYYQTTADSTGNINLTVDHKKALPPLPYADMLYFGALPGETLYISAHDGRPNTDDITGVLWSNTWSETM